MLFWPISLLIISSGSSGLFTFGCFILCFFENLSRDKLEKGPSKFLAYIRNTISAKSLWPPSEESPPLLPLFQCCYNDVDFSFDIFLNLQNNIGQGVWGKRKPLSSVIVWDCSYSLKCPLSVKLSKILRIFKQLRVLCASQFQIPDVSNLPSGKHLDKPRALEKFCQMPGPAGNFCWQMPHRPFLLWRSNARPPVHPTNIQKSYLPFFNKHNCFSSIELHKTDHEMSHSDWDKAYGFFAFIGVSWSINARLF